MIVKDQYTTREVADLLRVDVQTVRRYIRQGRIRVIKINQRMQRIPFEAISYLLPREVKNG